MKFSKMIFVLTIAASAIFICMMGSSYAYYTATATDISVTTGTINNGISVEFDKNIVEYNNKIYKVQKHSWGHAVLSVLSK